MKKVRGLIALFVCLTVSSAMAAETFTVEPAHTSVIFSISHFGYSFTYGRFNTTAGRFAIDKANPTASQFAFTVDVASIDTNDKKRDEHLRGADFFDVAQFPKISFTSSSVVKTEKGYDVTGDLTMHGVTKQVTLPLVAMGEGLGPYGKYRSGLTFHLEVKRSDYGMKKMVGPIGDNVAVTASFEGVRDEKK